MKRRHFFSTMGIGGILASSMAFAPSAKANSRVTKNGGGRIDRRLKELGIILPQPTKAVAVYAPYRIVGNLAYIAGQGPIDSPEHPAFGRVGHDLSIQQGYQAARTTGLNILAQLKAACDGDLDRVVQCVQINGYVKCTDDFTDSPKVINGASELFRDVFGESGLAARAAMGINALPFDIACEIISVWEISR